MNELRRDLLKYISTGSATVLLRSVVSGIPAAALLTMSAPSMAANSRNEEAMPPQFLMFSMRTEGDPMNINCPGSYDSGVDVVVNNPSPKLAPVEVSLGGQIHRASTPWSTLPQWALDRTAFIHHRTYQGIHSQFGNVMEMVGKTRGPEGEANFPDHLSSIISHAMAEPDRFGTIQSRPIRFGGGGVKYQNQSVQEMSPSALQSLFDAPSGVEKQLQDLRDQEVNKFSDMLKQTGNKKASKSQTLWLDQHIRSKEELRSLNIQLLEGFTKINSGDLHDQIDAALLCFKLNLSSVATIGIPFGGDNHNDEDWENEINGTISGCNDMTYFFNRIEAEGLKDQVTLANLNVFGRTFRQIRTGRSHNAEHHMMAITGANINPGVIGGLMQIGSDAGATGINSLSGASTNSGDIPATETLESAAKTLAFAVGVSKTVINTRIQAKGENSQGAPVGKIIHAAIKNT
ncbi:hypothetical protein [Marinicellulosiphila megalodicopiae]|uniref:hypothetical protein n=1 Tax=Marinicellulosiphila megalodicopiae TaxID=2724896 RepID=UPI003BB1A632